MGGYHLRGKNENLEVVRFRWIFLNFWYFLNNIFLLREKKEARERSCGGSSRSIERERWEGRWRRVASTVSSSRWSRPTAGGSTPPNRSLLRAGSRRSGSRSAISSSRGSPRFLPFRAPLFFFFQINCLILHLSVALCFLFSVQILLVC